MLPIPFIEVDSIKINFTIELNSVSTQTQSQQFQEGDSWGFNGDDINANCQWSYQQQESSSLVTQKDYHMEVLVTAGQAPIPAGMDRILDWMQHIIAET